MKTAQTPKSEKNNNAKNQTPKIRVLHTDTTRKDAARFYVLGLTLPEISKQVDVPLRTLERWQSTDKWFNLRNSEPIKDKVCEMYENGISKQDISDKINLSYTTVYRYIKAYEDEKATARKRKK